MALLLGMMIGGLCTFSGGFIVLMALPKPARRKRSKPVEPPMDDDSWLAQQY